MSAILPENPSQSNATVGKDYLLSINTGTVAVPVWTLVGGQRGASLSRTADEIKVGHKTSGGWNSVKAGLRSWGIDLSGLVLLQDEGVRALETAFMNGQEVNVRLLYPNGSVQTGWGSLTDFSMETPHDGEASLKGKISGNGALSARTPDVDVYSFTMSKAAATDKVLTITPSTTTVTSVKNGATTLTSLADYSYTAGALTVESTYISGLAVGTHVLTITTGENATLTVAMTLTA